MRALGVRPVLVTCDDDNFGSATVIERCGGVFDTLTRTDDGHPSAATRSSDQLGSSALAESERSATAQLAFLTAPCTRSRTPECGGRDPAATRKRTGVPHRVIAAVRNAGMNAARPGSADPARPGGGGG